jgi:hypothetical protein
MFKQRCIFCYLPLFAACAALTRVGAAAGGAALGALGGPGTAAAGAAVGVGLAEATIVETQMEPQAPTSVWEMISQLLDQAQWLSYSLLGLWLMTWIAPPPTQMVAKLRAVLAATRPQPPAE